MKKLIKFQPNAKTFFSIAEEKYDEGDYPSAVHYFYKSYLKQGDINSLVALGETYADLGEPERGLKYLFLALDRDYNNIDIRESIADCFLDLDEEETAFFYFRQSISVKHFKEIMEECDDDNGLLPRPPIRVLEKNDSVPLSIAIKLLQSGDIDYAKEVLLTIKPESEQYGSACNLLALTELDGGQPEKALEYALKSLEKKDNIDARCDMMMAYHALGDLENAQKAADALEALRPKTDEHKTIAFAYIKTGDAGRALKHLKIVNDSGMGGRDILVSYALALYNTGEKEQARQIMVSALKTYPGDLTVKTLAAELAAGRPLGLYPFLDVGLAKDFCKEIDEKLDILRLNGENPFICENNSPDSDGDEADKVSDGEANKENDDALNDGGLNAEENLNVGGSLKPNKKTSKEFVLNADENLSADKNKIKPDDNNDFFEDESFKEKIRWLFQNRFSGSQNRAALILGRHKRWHPFLRELLLDNDLELPTKKTCLFSLLGVGNVEKLGMVLDGLYTRLKPRYPLDMDGRFRAAYCLAFSAFAFSDAEFESRLFNAANKILIKYHQHRDVLTNEDTLAAVIFFAAKHKKISDAVKCAHLFGCTAGEMKKYMTYLEVDSGKSGGSQKQKKSKQQPV